MSASMLRVAMVAGAFVLVAAGCQRHSVNVVQRGYRGLGMNQLYDSRTLEALLKANSLPPAAAPAPAEGPPVTAVYHNVQVLTDLNVAQFVHTMVAITNWVAPANQSCSYCHTSDLASDANYRKVVARTMLRMVREINTNWKSHVGDVGVTCYTCHRGNDVPSYVWYQQRPEAARLEFAGSHFGQNGASPNVGMTALPNDPFSVFLDGSPENIRVVSTTALRNGPASTIKNTERSYGLMIDMSEALGVNCTFCHNTRSFTSWDQSTPQRATAWYGIRMVRQINDQFLTSLMPILPADRKGPLGDVAKVNCQTCHQGVYKPLFGASMLKDYPELSGVMQHPAVTPAGEAVR